MLFFFNTTFHKENPSFILSSLLPSHMVSCCKKNNKKNCSWQRREQHFLLFTVFRGLISTLCKSLMAKSRGETDCIISFYIHVLKIHNCLHRQFTHMHLPRHLGSFHQGLKLTPIKCGSILALVANTLAGGQGSTL
jgi:hypothetical protein